MVVGKKLVNPYEEMFEDLSDDIDEEVASELSGIDEDDSQYYPENERQVQ